MESPVIDIQDAWKAYGDVAALRGISLVFHPQRLGLLGSEGRGKNNDYPPDPGTAQSGPWLDIALR